MKLSRSQLRELLQEELGFEKIGKAKDFEAEHMKHSVDTIVRGYGKDRFENPLNDPRGIMGDVGTFKSELPEPFRGYVTEMFANESLEHTLDFSNRLAEMLEQVMKHYKKTFIPGLKSLPRDKK